MNTIGLGNWSAVYYNVNVASSVTACGKSSISTAGLSFEAFLANNVKFRKLDEIIVFINHIIKERPKRQFNDRDILDSSVAAGCKSIKNKADVYGVIMPLRKKEQDIADMMLEKFPNKTKPNRCLHMDKMRFSAVEQGIKIYFYLDLNTGRYEDCFVTTKYDQPMTLTKTRLFFLKNNP